MALRGCFIFCKNSCAPRVSSGPVETVSPPPQVVFSLQATLCPWNVAHVPGRIPVQPDKMPICRHLMPMKDSSCSFRSPWRVSPSGCFVCGRDTYCFASVIPVFQKLFCCHSWTCPVLPEAWQDLPWNILLWVSSQSASACDHYCNILWLLSWYRMIQEYECMLWLEKRCSLLVWD